VPTVYRFAGGVVLVGAMLAVAACDGPPPKPAIFNDRIARNNDKWNTAVTAFKAAMEPVTRGGTVSSAQANDAFNTLEKELTAVKRASHHMPAPSSEGRNLLQKYQAYLDNEDEILHGEVKQVVNTVGDGNLSAADKSRKVAELYSSIQTRSKKAWDELMTAQREFCKVHNLSPSAATGK
jgi:hypothetical protein